MFLLNLATNNRNKCQCINQQLLLVKSVSLAFIILLSACGPQVTEENLQSPSSSLNFVPGSNTEQNDNREPITAPTLNEEQKAFEATLYPLLTKHCSKCHNGDATIPSIAHEDITQALKVITDNGLIDPNDPDSSILVDRLAVQEHSCWSDCDINAKTVKLAISDFNNILNVNENINTPTIETPVTTPAVEPVVPPATPPIESTPTPPAPTTPVVTNPPTEVVTPPVTTPPTDGGTTPPTDVIPVTPPTDTGEPILPNIIATELEIQAYVTTLYPILQTNCSTCHGDTTTTGANAFAQSDTALATAVLLENNYISVTNVNTSPLVQRLVIDNHFCWNNCTADASRVSAALTEMKALLDSSTTPVDPTPPNTVPAEPVLPSAEQEAAFNGDLYPLLTTHCATCHGDTNAANAPKFAQSDIKLAYSVLVTNSLVDINNPPVSRLVQRLVNGKHFCWSDCTTNGSALSSAIYLMGNPITDPTPTPPVQPPAPQPNPVPPGTTVSELEAFSATTFPILSEYCAECHSGATALTDLANPDPQLALNTLVNQNFINTVAPGDSEIVTRLSELSHACWSDCIADASRLEGSIVQFNSLINTPAIVGNSNPVATDDVFTTSINTAITTDSVLLNDSDIDGDVLAISSADTNTVNGGSIVNNINGTFTYTPATGFAGEDTFTYTLIDGNGGSSIGNVKIIVESLQNSNLPQAVDDTLFTNANVPITTEILLSNDINPTGGILSITTVDPISREGGTVSITAVNQINYNPAFNFTGEDQFSYTLTNDLGVTAIGLVSVNVNSQPVAISDAIYTYTNINAENINALANDIDIDNNVLTITSFDSATAEAGSVTYNGDGTFSYEPPRDFQGNDSFTYIVSDGNGGTAQSTVFISVLDEILRDDNRFLQFLNTTSPKFLEDADTARAYYSAVDPLDARTNLDDWLQVNGFNIGADALAIYINANDLGFARRMSVRTDPLTGIVSSYVENYANIQDAIDQDNVIATVAMEHTVAPGVDPLDPEQARYTTFYVFDDNNRRALGADLDGRGFKFVPGLCNVCHGGEPKALVNGFYPDNGDTGAGHIPWDLDTFEFSDETATVSRSEQEGQFKVMNQTVLLTNPNAAQIETIEGWYGGPGMPANVFNGQFIPQGWLSPAAPSNGAQLYLQVVAPYCRTCHIMRGNNLQSDIDFTTYDKFMSYKSAIETTVFDQGVMPLALLTYDRFWADVANAPVSLANFLQSSKILEADVILTPGRPIANAGPAIRQASLGVVPLNGNSSFFTGGNAAFNFSLTERPAGSNAVIDNPRAADTFFIADVAGRYVVELVVNDGIGATPPSPPAEIIIDVAVTLQAQSFVSDIVPIFNKCAACHTGFDKPKFDNLSILYNNVINYVDLNDPLNSKILTKPSGSHHGGGVIPGFETPLSDDAQSITQWILEGAPDN